MIIIENRGDEEPMKFSDSLFLDNDSAGMQQTIEKLTKKSSSSQGGEIVKIKKDFMHAVVDVPEFDQTVTELSNYTRDHGTSSDKGQMRKIQRKIQEGNIDYDDIVDLSNIGQKNYKYFFKKPPASFVFNPATAIGFVLTIVAICIRCTSDGNMDLTSIIILASVNLIAIVYTLCLWPNSVVENLTLWMADNAVPDIISTKLISPVSKKMWRNVIIFFAFSLSVLFLVSFIKNFALGNDILAIISLSISVLSDKIVELFVNIYEWRIYRDKER